MSASITHARSPSGSAPVPLALSAPRSMWLVAAERVDVFAGAGPSRRFLFAVEAGEALFGMHHPGAGSVALSATRAPGARLRASPRALLEVRGGEGHADSADAARVERWVGKLALALAPAEERAPESMVRLEAGGDLVQVERGTAIGAPAARLAVTWVRPLSGAFRLFGEEPRIEAGQTVPLPSGAWLVADEDCELASIDTSAWLALDPGMSALDAFHALALARLERRAQDEATRERALAHAHQAREAETMDHALRGLSSVLDGQSGPRAAGGVADGDDAVLAVFRELGRRLGFEVAAARPDAPGAPLSVRAIARASRIRVRRVTLRGQWWASDSGPMIGVLAESARPVALVPSASGYRAVGPDGVEQAVDAALAAKIAPVANAVHRPLPARRRPLPLLGFALGGALRTVVLAILAGAGASLLGLLPPVATGLLIDRIIPGALRSELAQMALLLVACALTSTSLVLVRGLATLRVVDRASTTLQVALWDHLLRLPATFFRGYSAGDLAARASGVEDLRALLPANAWATLFSAAFALPSYGLMLYYDAQLGLYATALTIAACLVFLVFGLLRLGEAQALRRLSGLAGALLLQLVGGVLKLKLAGAERRAFAVWAERHAAARQRLRRGREVETGVAVISAVLPVVGSAVLFAAVGSRPALSAGDFLAFSSAFGAFLGAALGAVQLAFTVADVVPLLQRLAPILAAEGESARRRADPGVLRGAIEISDLTFSYAENAPPVLDHVRLSASPGEMIAIVGRSGSGKSTLLRLLIGFERPNAGGIYLDGQDLASLDLGAVRRQMGVVLQGNHILPGTILHNIIGTGSLTLDDAWEAARRVALDEDIRRMPMNMQTLLDQGGSSLSGGQRQRLVLARAIARRPRILLLDEATSALDNQTQRLVAAQLEELNVTRVVIAHRLSTIARADRVYVLDQGRVVQQGTFATLLAEPGPFRALAERQLL